MNEIESKTNTNERYEKTEPCLIPDALASASRIVGVKDFGIVKDVEGGMECPTMLKRSAHSFTFRLSNVCLQSAKSKYTGVSISLACSFPVSVRGCYPCQFIFTLKSHFIDKAMISPSLGLFSHAWQIIGSRSSALALLLAFAFS